MKTENGCKCDKKYKVTIGVFAAIFSSSFEIILVKHKYGKRGRSMPGGGVDKRPSRHLHSWSTLKIEVEREIIEEVGKFKFILNDLPLVTFSPDSDDVRIIFIGETNDFFSFSHLSNDEIQEVGLFKINNLPKDLYFPQGIYIKKAFEHI